MTPQFYLGVDLGEEQNFTARAVLELKMDMKAKPVKHGSEHMIAPEAKLISLYHLRYLERFDLGTPYPEIADRVYTQMQLPELVGETALIVDATGVGRPVVEMMQVKKLSPIPVVIHGGTELTMAPNGYHVPKRELISALLVLYQSQRIRIAPRMPYVPEFEGELKAFSRRVKGGHDVYGAWREGEYDDLVLAVALAAWYATYINPWERRLRNMRPHKKDWNPLAFDDEDEEKQPGLYNPMRYGGRN